MANPASAASHESEAATNSETETFETKVNSIVDAITRDEKGKYVLPDNLSEETKFAAIAEKRRRDTQSEYTKVNQRTKALEAEKAVLLKKVAGSVTIEITEAQAAELEDLKFSDPEAWRKKMNRYENDAATKQTKTIDEELKQVSTSSLANEELERRKQVLVDFNRLHPDFVMSDEVIANDIPPRIVKRLETGEISFEAFLEECFDYTHTGKVVKQDKAPAKQPNLSKVGGSSKPDDNAIQQDIIKSYQTEVF